eukprot:scaffold99502_cov26-Prasinocladus_malaysianus.AAC.1
MCVQYRVSQNNKRMIGIVAAEAMLLASVGWTVTWALSGPKETIRPIGFIHCRGCQRLMAPKL